MTRRSPVRLLPRGFTLLEVMIAMAILGTVFVVLLQNHMASLRLAEHGRRVSVAINLAKDLMTRLETEEWPDNGWPEVGAEQGDFSSMYGDAYVDYRWEREVNPNSFWEYVLEVTVRVYYGPAEEDKVEILQFLAAMNSDQQSVAEEQWDGESDSTEDDGSGTGSESETGTE